MDLHAQPTCTDYLHRFLDLVKYEMLVVKSPNLGGKERADIGTVRRSLTRMLDDCNKKPDYASRPAPWPRKKGDYKEEAIEAEVTKSVADTLRRRKLRQHGGRTLSQNINVEK